MSELVDDSNDVHAEATRRVLALAAPLFPVTLSPDVPDVVRIAVALLARCMTITDACLHLAQLGRRADLMVAVRTLFEHTVTFTWLLGDPDQAEERVLLWERYCDEQGLKLDNERVRHGGTAALSMQTRTEITTSATVPLEPARMPDLAARADQADREWAERLDFVRAGSGPFSLRGLYTVAYRVGSSMAHPSLAGIRLNQDRRSGHTVVDFEPRRAAHQALMPVPALAAIALGVSADTLGRPRGDELEHYLDWYAAHRS